MDSAVNVYIKYLSYISYVLILILVSARRVTHIILLFYFFVKYSKKIFLDRYFSKFCISNVFKKIVIAEKSLEDSDL